MQCLSLVERVTGRLAKIWLVGCDFEPREGGKVLFEFGYIGGGYGANSAILTPSGKDYPRLWVSIPHAFQNMPQGQIFEKGSYFTIDKIETKEDL